MAATVGTVPASLYQVLGRPVGVEGTATGTSNTRQVETIDDDQVRLDVLPAVADLPLADPGTRLTFTVETIDNDDVAALPALDALAAPADPGTTHTSSVETTDEDALSQLGALP